MIGFGIASIERMRYRVETIHRDRLSEASLSLSVCLSEHCEGVSRRKGRIAVTGIALARRKVDRLHITGWKTIISYYILRYAKSVITVKKCKVLEKKRRTAVPKEFYYEDIWSSL